MKAKVIETGEIVNVTPYPTWYKENGQGPDRREWDEDELEFIYSNDNVEPKFNVREWIVNNRHKDVFFINNITSRYCTLEDTKGIIYQPSLPLSENDFHLWTIDDAKEGDVLAYETDEEDLWIMIYWSLYEPYEGHVHYHALLVNDNFSDKGTCCICIDNLKPATKEQRDLLFQKMKEAGYEWDAEKKELKKIEQKSAWCPSKKQMESLKDMLKYNIGVFDYQKFMEVNSLYDDLKKIIKTQE